jgi:putative aminopeptidase FrvX
MQRDYNLLKTVLSVPTKTYQEDMMVEFLTNWLKENNFSFTTDNMKNIYVTKQTDKDIEYFPCVVSHIDTVHNIEPINIKEETLVNEQRNYKLALKAYNDLGKPTGIGGDDKCGVYACHESFKNAPRYQSHPYTDVYALKSLFDFSCINFAIGYYNYHTRNEYVVVEDVYNGISAGKKLIESLGYKKYKKVTKEKSVLFG